ncbi:kinase-like domain-containing protein [Mycena latifolia]|nr:kinase-like domain-containing protein [Mycena latifolia]
MSAADVARIVQPNATLTGLRVLDIAVTHVADCVQNPPNPRQPGLYLPPAHPSLTSNPDLLAKAHIAIASLQNAHASAIHNATHPDNVARSKVRGSAATIKSVPRLQVKISKALNANAARASEKNSSIMPTLTDWPETAPVSEVKQSIAATVDFHYSKKYNFRVTSDDITLIYANSGTVINEAHASGTLARLWRNSSGIAVSAKDRRNGVLDIHVSVQYPLKVSSEDIHSDDSDVSSDIFVGPGKRKASTSTVIRSSKRIALTPAGAGAYRTSIQINEQQYVVSRIDCTIDDLGASIFTEESQPLYVSVREEPSASGTTKKMFILTLNGVHYAAKCFFDIGARAPTPEENLRHLKNELTCQKQAARYLRVAESFILRVVSGPQKHHAWIVDPLLSTLQTVKFSGTDVAGSHCDLFGATCDALAHFSLEDSEEYLVFVDIQGIKEPNYIHGARGSDELVLFDLMAHTQDGATNLGDKGPAGVQDFKLQHKCNSICKRTPLRATGRPGTTTQTQLTQSDEKRPAPAPPTFRVRIGKGAIDESKPISTPRTPRGALRFAGAAFKHTLAIDSSAVSVFGPFDVCEATLTHSRIPARRAIELYKFSERSGGTTDSNTDVHVQEITRYADARELIEEFEDSLEQSQYTLTAVASDDDKSLHCKSLH